MPSFCSVFVFTLTVLPLLYMMMTMVSPAEAAKQHYDDLDNLYMIHYNGLDTLPIEYGACAPLKKEDKQPGIVLLTDRLAHCTAYNDIECEEQASYPVLIEPGLTDLTELGKEFSKFAFMVCTIDT